jgi:membrane-bound lytic murein transglycosylase MltF
MPGTWSDAQLALGFVANRTNVKQNIRAAGWYMSKMLHIWRGRGRSNAEKLPLAQSSYNCGAGCVLRAQKRAMNARDWPQLAEFLPAEARDYPIHIERHWRRMKEN